MASLADELLADLGSDESGGEEEQDQEQQQGQQQQTNRSTSSHSNGKRNAVDLGHEQSEGGDGNGDGDPDPDGDGLDIDEDVEMAGGSTGAGRTGTMPLAKNAVKPSEEMDKEEVEAMDFGPGSVGSVRDVSKLMSSRKMEETIKAIDHYAALDEPDVAGVLEESPEYQLIVKANNLAVDVDNEILVVHKFIRDHYSPKFPELETLILNPWEFVRAVQALGNEEDMSKANLEGILPHGTVVVISMTASTTNGKPLTPQAWARVEEACKLVFELEAARRKILQYVESRMTFLAPNLSAVVGTRVATKILGVAGGLTGLSKIPACNVHLLGATRKTPTGLSSAHQGRHNGFIFQSDLVQSTGEGYHRQAQRMVAAKALLAARMDAGRAQRDGSYGHKLYEELEKKLEKLQEPPPAALIKALPVPSETAKKRRGGRRARKAKERYGMTELRKMQNRVQFGQAEEESGAFDETIGLGMINNSSSGRIRATTGEARSKAKISKANKNRLAMLKNQSRSLEAGSSGTASSLSFTPVQGIELIDPARQKKINEANEKWFKEGQFSLLPSKSGAGTSQIPGSSGPPAGSSGSMGPPAAPRR